MTTLSGGEDLPKKRVLLFELSSSDDETDSKRKKKEKVFKLPSITIPPLKRGREDDTGLRAVSGKVCRSLFSSSASH
jgi:hypothetical protein